MQFNHELIQLGKSVFARQEHKELLKKAFSDKAYNAKQYRLKKFNRFLEEQGYFVKTYDWYKEWYLTFLESAYSDPILMEKNIISLFLSLPLDAKGLLIFDEIFFYYETHLFGDFWERLARSRVLDEFFIYCSDPFMYHYTQEDFLQIMTLLKEYAPYCSNYDKWRTIVSDTIPATYTHIPPK